jgi:hypothetical protein
LCEGKIIVKYIVQNKIRVQKLFDIIFGSC